MSERRPASEIDALLQQQIARWALVVTMLLALFDIAMLRSWPFPDALDILRGPFYVLLGVILVLATVAITFLGYRIVTMGLAQRVRSVYLIFLPSVFLASTIVGFALLTAPR